MPAYESYADVPFYRRNGFLILLALVPFGWLALLPLMLTGTGYYERRGELRSYTRAARAALVMVCVVVGFAMVQQLRGLVRPSARAAVTAAVPAPVARPVHVEYDVIILGDAGGSLEGYALREPRAINNRGEVVGVARSVKGAREQGARWRDGKLELMGFPTGDPGGRGEDQSEAVDINDAGVAVGSWRHGRDRRAVIWEPGQPARDLGLPESIANASPAAINEAGVVVGRYFPHQLNQGFMWDRGRFTTLGAFAPSDKGVLVSFATDINDQGTVIGRASSSHGATGFVWRDGQMREMQWPEGGPADVSGRSINANGEIAGCVTRNQPPLEDFPVLWDASGAGKALAPTTRSTFQGQKRVLSACADGINAHGAVVGHVQDSRTFIWTPTDGLRLLDELVDLQAAGLRDISHVQAINDRGEIIGWGRRRTLIGSIPMDLDAGILLRPKPR